MSDGAQRIGRLLLLRHGQSIWNVTCPIQNTTARFTGWADIELTPRGMDQAKAAGRALFEAQEMGLLGGGIDVAFTSLLVRARDTLTLALGEMNLVDDTESDRLVAGNKLSMKLAPSRYLIPAISSWRLNERHYGSLVGMSKEGAERLYGKKQLSLWRDSWHICPPPMAVGKVRRWSQEAHCTAVTVVRDPGGVCRETGTSFRSQDHLPSVQHSEQGPVRGNFYRQKQLVQREYILREKNEHTTSSLGMMPASESLRDTFNRVVPLWIQGIAPRLRAGETVLVSAHANTLRALVHLIDPSICTQKNMKKIKIPSATPLLYEVKEVSDKNGITSSHVIPGNLKIVPPVISTGGEERYRLQGQWIESDEISALSFCSEVGQTQWEHIIA